MARVNQSIDSALISRCRLL